MTDYLLQLHEDAIINIGEYTGKLYGPETYTRLGQTCKRLRRLLLADDVATKTIQNVIRTRIASQQLMPHTLPGELSITSPKELAVFEAWCLTPLREDNRIPFPFASVEVEESMHQQIHHIMKIMERYSFITIQLDSHCETLPPNSVAFEFSRSRGHSVKDALYDNSRVEVVGWGKRVAQKVARSNTHPFGELARLGRGWVEVYIVLGGG